jgi:hypothetical protein
VESGVSGTPGMTGVIVVLPLVFVFDPPKSAPTFIDDAVVLTTPFATFIGAVEYVRVVAIDLPYELVVLNSNIGISSSPPLLV